jgi:hypothetical protein
MFPSHISRSNPSRLASRASRPRQAARHARVSRLALVPSRPDDARAVYALYARLDAAAALLPADPDAAALVLEGALHELIVHWYARQGLRPPAPERLLADLAERDELLALRLRLALRAPDVAARLGHLRALIRLLDAEVPGSSPPAPSPCGARG